MHQDASIYVLRLVKTIAEDKFGAKNEKKKMRVTSNESPQNLISGLSSERESFYEATTYPIKFLLKLYQTTIMEREMQEITVQPSKARTDVGKRIIVRELSSSEFGFQELPVCWFSHKCNVCNDI